MEKALRDAGYEIKYLDELDIKKVIVRYDGDAVTVGESFLPGKCVVTLLFESGGSKEISGSSEEMIFLDTRVSKIGENEFTAVYDDSFIDPIESEVFTVTGVNAISRVDYAYVGPSVWLGEALCL